MVNYCNHIVENQISWRVSCCSVAPVSLLGVLMKLQPLCCNQGAVGGNTARLPLNLFALFNHNQHIYFPALVAAAKRIITTNVSRLCNPVDLVNLRSRRPVILTDIFGSRITKSNPKAQNQIKAKTNVCCWLRALSLKLNLLCLLHRETVQVYSWIISLPAGSPRIRTLIHCILSTRCSNTMEQHLSGLLSTVVCRAVY